MYIFSSLLLIVSNRNIFHGQCWCFDLSVCLTVCLFSSYLESDTKVKLFRIKMTIFEPFKLWWYFFYIVAHYFIQKHILKNSHKDRIYLFVSFYIHLYPHFESGIWVSEMPNKIKICSFLFIYAFIFSFNQTIVSS